MTMKHVSSRHTPKRWGVKKATSKKVAKLELFIADGIFLFAAFEAANFQIDFFGNPVMRTSG